MAARRLLVIMLVLLGVSTVAAALAPAPEQRGRDAERDTTAPETTKQPEPDRTGELVEEEIASPASGAPETIAVSTGDQLQLTVRVERPSEVDIPAFGLIEFATPGAPARFDLLINRSGTFEVRRAGETIAVIEARDRRPNGERRESEQPKRDQPDGG